MHTNIIFSNDVARHIQQICDEIRPSKTFIIKDSEKYPSIEYFDDFDLYKSAIQITIDSGENNKSVDTLSLIWKEMLGNNADRNSLIINFGGGMVTDIGGFAAATFKRGIRYINIPTTLLSAVDASIGGKTAINFENIKNAIGAFHEPSYTIISSRFFDTLPQCEILSGKGEMLKHVLLKNADFTANFINSDIQNIATDSFLEILKESVMVKAEIVEKDPTEDHLRKALNFGHTIDHAFESLALTKGSLIPHGIAVAYGIVAELILSHLQLKFPSSSLYQISTFVKENFGTFPLTCNDYDSLIDFMRQDKKER